jgi:tetratricopeptide (TPR) repeat protein
MVYLLVTVAHFKQLGKVNQDLLVELEAGLKTACERHGVPWQSLREGTALYPLGSEAGIEARRALEFVFPVLAVLEDKKEELFGFQLLIAASSEPALRQLKGLLLACEEDAQLWIEAGAISLFSGLVESQRVGELWKVTSRSLPQEPAREARTLAWVQEGLVFQAFRILKEQMSSKSSERGLYLYGPVAQDRRAIVDALQVRLAGSAAVQRFPRLYTLFQRRSVLHPFLNSLDPVFLPHAARYLRPLERKVWDDLSDLLAYLKPASELAQNLQKPLAGWPHGVPTGLSQRDTQPGPAPGTARGAGPTGLSQRDMQPGPAPGTARGAAAKAASVAGLRNVELCPDHLAEDFFLVYQLYLAAYFRMLEENFLPAVLICEDVETYQPTTLRYLALLMKDFGQLSAFLPVFSSSAKQLPEELGFLTPTPLAARPLRLKEMGRLAAELYPGLKLPRLDWQAIRLRVGGRPILFHHALQFLERKGLIGAQDGQYRWQGAEHREQALPKRALTLTWQVASGLGAELERTLYIVYLQQGLLDLSGLFGFLASLGIAEEEAVRRLTALADLGLIHLAGHAVPVFPGLRKRLRRRVLDGEPGLEEKLMEYLIGLWRRGAFPHRVLLFFLLIKSRHAATAYEVLGELLRRKLDELDFAGVRIFLEPKNFHLTTAMGAVVEKSLQLLLGAVRIRYSLLGGSRRDAESAYLKAVDLGSDFQVSPLKGDLFLQIARYLATRGETNIALQWAKKAQIQFQSCNAPAGEREATLEVGSVMLADGRLDEALEYFNLAEQAAAREASLSQLRLAGLRTAALFIQGNLSRAQTEALDGLARAGRLKRREWELALSFLAARIQFELGSYEQAARGFQEALAVEALYPAPAAREVLYAWLARALAYGGSPAEAQRVLSSLKENWEQCLFLAEACCFQREYSRALEHCGKALSVTQNPESFPGERFPWADGFAGMEGHCVILAKDGALSLRLIQGLQAYLWGLQGSVERAGEQLHAITRSGRIPETDPYQSLYHYWYACILPDLRMEEMDDRMTVLNKALQLLQQRASRIEDSTLRWHFLNNNHWNTGLFAEARQRKLI